MLQKYLYRDSDFIVDLKVENIGDPPLIPPSSNFETP